MTALARTGSLSGVTAVPSGGADIEKAQQRVIELRGTLARLDEIPNDLSKKADTVPAAIWADAREKYERAGTELKFAIENLQQAQTAAERTETALVYLARVLGKMTGQPRHARISKAGPSDR